MKIQKLKNKDHPNIEDSGRNSSFREWIPVLDYSLKPTVTVYEYVSDDWLFSLCTDHTNTYGTSQSHTAY